MVSTSFEGVLVEGVCASVDALSDGRFKIKHKTTTNNEMTITRPI